MLRETCTRKSHPISHANQPLLLLTLARRSSNVVLRHAPRQASDVVLQCEILALEPVVVVAHELDTLGDLEQAELGLTRVSGYD